MKLFVELVPSHLRKIIAARIEEHAFKQASGVVDVRRLARTYLLVEFKKTTVRVTDLISVLLKASGEHGIFTEKLGDLLIRPYAKGADKNSDSDLAGAVNPHIEDIIRIRLIFKPCAAIGNDRAGIKSLSQFIMIDIIINAGRPHQLADNDTLRSVDDERAGVGHQRQIPHEDLGFLNVLRLIVDKTNLNFDGRGVRCIPLFALFYRILDIILAQSVINKLKAKMPGKIGNRRNIIEHFPESLVQKPLIGFLLNLNKVRNAQNLVLPGVAHPYPSPGFYRTHPVLFHRRFTP